MKITCLQMDMLLGRPRENSIHAEQMIEQAMAQMPDVLVLPETWNTGFFPTENLPAMCCTDGSPVRCQMSNLAKKYRVNIVAGSISNLRDGHVFNTAMVFDRNGCCIAEYDKTHLFTPMGEDQFYKSGDHLCSFSLDGVRCGLIICYDIRFPELTRTLTVAGLDMLFMVSQWPEARISHLQTLTAARAIENQIFVVCCNSCGSANQIKYGGHSAIIDPWGKTLALAGSSEQLLSAECAMDSLTQIRNTIPVFRDRRPDLYKI